MEAVTRSFWNEANSAGLQSFYVDRFDHDQSENEQHINSHLVACFSRNEEARKKEVDHNIACDAWNEAIRR